MVHELVGQSARFDFGQAAAQLPRLDLPALRPFLHAMLALNRRKVRDDMDVLSFKTPEEWLSELSRAGASWRSRRERLGRPAHPRQGNPCSNSRNVCNRFITAPGPDPAKVT
jgi:hypothetical protein